MSKTKFSKQRVKGNSESEIFVKRFPCCQKIREALVIFGLKRYLIIYPDANTSIITIWLVVAIKASHEQVPSLEKKASMAVADQNQSLGGILQNGVLNNFAKFI